MVVTKQNNDRSRRRKRSGSTVMKNLRIAVLCLVIASTAINLILLIHNDAASFLAFSHSFLVTVDPSHYSWEHDILPKKIITVIGKESSGTTFIARTIATALKLPGRMRYRDGYYHHERRRYDENPIQVQHVSLPQGGWCRQNHNHHIVDVILPAQCIRDKYHKYPGATNANIRQQCEQLMSSQNHSQIFEGMAQVQIPWFMESEKWRAKLFYGFYRYPGRDYGQSEIARSNNATTRMRQRGGKMQMDVGRATTEQRRNLQQEEHHDFSRRRLGGLRLSNQNINQKQIQDWIDKSNDISLEELKEANLVKYPTRIILNITAQRIWYEALEVEQVIVIVVRDEAMSLQSRLKNHCRIVELAQEEEQIANNILNNAIKTFMIQGTSELEMADGPLNTTDVYDIMDKDFMWDPSPIIENRTDASDLLHASLIPSNNNVILVSYEAMMKYKQDYISEMYNVLGIESHFEPKFKDGNAKYKEGDSK